MEKSSLKNLNEDSEEIKKLKMDADYSKTLKCGRRTYFFDIKTAKTGGKYLKVTESRLEEENKRRRSNIIIFEEDFSEFKKVVEEVTNHAKEKAKIFRNG